MRVVPLAAAVLALLVADGMPARAQSGLLESVLPHEKGKAVCYASSPSPVTYQLEDNPPRERPRTITVQRFLFLLRAATVDADPSTKPPTPERAYHQYGLMAELVGTNRRLRAAGECNSLEPGAFACHVECDGGGARFERLAGTEPLLMRIGGRMRMTWGCDEDRESEVLRDTAATPAIRFEKAEPEACVRIARYLDRLGQ